MEHAVLQLEKTSFVQRLLQKDASLWSADKTRQKFINARLSWLNMPDIMPVRADEISGYAQHLREQGVTKVLIGGMGGCANAARAYTTIWKAEGPFEVRVIDTLDPSEISAAAQWAKPGKAAFIASSKSGETHETLALLSYFHKHFAVTGHPEDYLAAITDDNSPLLRRMEEWGVQNIFINPADVGGRYAPHTFYALAAAALSGADIKKLLSAAAQAREDCFALKPAENPGVYMGAVLAALAREGKDKLTFFFTPELESLAPWFEQLLAGSTGLEHESIVPVIGESPRHPSHYGTDRVFVRFSMKNRPHTPEFDVLIRTGRPCIDITLDDRYDITAEMTRWMFASVTLGALLCVDSFDEPDVSAAKDTTAAILKKLSAGGEAEISAPAFEDTNFRIYADAGLKISGTAAQMLAAHIKRAAAGHYMALISFLSSDPSKDRQITHLRSALSARRTNPLLSVTGPAYLHSAGQLFKGGQNNGLFIMITEEDDNSLSLAGQPFTFAQAKLAQAVADMSAMCSAGRRIMRIHCKNRAALDRLVETAAAINA